MKVLFINQFFHPDVAATAQLLTDLVGDLSAAGCDVTVVTGRASYADGHDLGPPRDSRGKAQIYRVGGVPLRRKTVWSRMLSYLVFWISATVRCLLLARHDVVVPLTTPPLLSCLGVALKWIKGSRLVCWSMDVYPELGVLLGAIRAKSLVTRLLGTLRSWSLRRCDLIVALGPHMAGRLASQGIPREKIRILPTWEDGGLVGPVPPGENPFRARHGLDDKFVVLYSGNLGAAHEFHTVLETASHLLGEQEIIFLFTGDGPRRLWVETHARSRGLANVRFLPYQPRECLRFSLSAGDAHLVTLRPGFEGLLFPSKFVAGLAAGRPILFVGPRAGEIPDAIISGQCGMVVEPEDWKGLMQAILNLRRDAGLRTRLGWNARAQFERRYSRERVTGCFADLLGHLAEGKTMPHAAWQREGCRSESHLSPNDPSDPKGMAVP